MLWSTQRTRVLPKCNLLHLHPMMHQKHQLQLWLSSLQSCKLGFYIYIYIYNIVLLHSLFVISNMLSLFQFLRLCPHSSFWSSIPLLCAAAFPLQKCNHLASCPMMHQKHQRKLWFSSLKDFKRGYMWFYSLPYLQFHPCRSLHVISWGCVSNFFF